MENRLMKKISLIISSILLFTFSNHSYSTALNPNNSLEKQCEKEGGGSYFIKNAHITFMNATVMWNPENSAGDWKVHNAINIKLKYNVENSTKEAWFGVFGENVARGSSAFGLSSFAQAMFLLKAPVDVCVKGKYLRGIENNTAS